MYESKAVLNCTAELQTMIGARDVFGLMFRLRGGLSRGRRGASPLHPPGGWHCLRQLLSRSAEERPPLRYGISRRRRPLPRHGLLHPGLFAHAHAGTKRAIDAYTETVVRALEQCAVAVAPPAASAALAPASRREQREREEERARELVPTAARLAFFNETRHAYGRTALLLSGGAALGIYHCGLVKVM